MNANATGSQLTETQARRRPRVFRSQSARRGGILATALSAAALAASCMPYSPPPSVPIEMLSTGDAVLAVWMREGRSVSGIGKPSYDSGIGLLDEEGNVDLSFIDERTVGDLAWTQRGLSYSEENNERRVERNVSRARLIDHWNIGVMSSPMGESRFSVRRGNGGIESTLSSLMER